MTAISLIITIKNEATSIQGLLDSIVAQTRPPEEVVIVDGGSSDQTKTIVQQFIAKQAKPTKQSAKAAIEWQFIVQSSNISQGRNLAISQAKHTVLAITDAGCLLEKGWLQQLESCYLNHKKTAKVVAGYYQGDPHTSFEEAVVPYALVMPDQVNAEQFLPATRSMLLEKKVWSEVGGFAEELTVSEDYAFAKKIVEVFGQKAIIFCPTAIVYWRPRGNLQSFFRMVAAQAEGDVKAGVMRGKAKLVVLRYVAGMILLMVVWQRQSLVAGVFLLSLLLAYLGWAVVKNKRYVKKGWYWLPVLQLTADLGVIWGSVKAVV